MKKQWLPNIKDMEGQDVIIVRELDTSNEIVMMNSQNSFKKGKQSRVHTRQLHMMTVKALD